MLSSADANSGKSTLHVIQQWLTFLLDWGSDSDLFLSILKHRFTSSSTSSSVSKITMNAIDTAELTFKQSNPTQNSRSLFVILGDVLEANSDGSLAMAKRRNGQTLKTYPHAKALKSWYLTICSMLSEMKSQEITLSRLVDKVISVSNVQADLDATINKLENAKRPARGGSAYGGNSFQGRSTQSSALGSKRSYTDISSNRSVNTTNSFSPFEEDENYLRVVNFVRDLKAEVSQFLKYRGGVSAKHHADNVRFQLKGFIEHLQHSVEGGRRLNELAYKAASQGNALYSSQLGSQQESFSTSESEHLSSQVALQGQLFLGTIHKAKGREWKVVILLKANDDVFRFSTVSAGDGEDDDDLVTASMDDERRLLFVALSRAKRLLVVSFVGKSREKLESELSRLLKPVLQLVGNSKQRTESGIAAGSSQQPAVMYTFHHDMNKLKPRNQQTTTILAAPTPSVATFSSSQTMWSSSALRMDGPSFQKASSVVADTNNKKPCVDSAQIRQVRTPLETINRPNSFQYHGRATVVESKPSLESPSILDSNSSSLDWNLSSSSSVQQGQRQSSNSDSRYVDKGGHSSSQTSVNRSGGYADHRLTIRQPSTGMSNSSWSRDSALQSFSQSADFSEQRK